MDDTSAAAFVAQLAMISGRQRPELTDRALINASIVGCPLAAPGTKPCTQVIQIILGLASETEIDALTPLLDTVQFVTDGVPGGKSVLLPEAAGITESR